MKITTPVVTLSFPHFDKAQEPQNEGDKPKFSGAFVFESRAALEPVYQAAVQVAVEKWGPTKGPKMVTIGGRGSTFRNDVEGKYPAGSIYISARSESKPGLVYRHAGDRKNAEGKALPALVEAEKIKEVFYPGAKVKAQLAIFAYEKKTNTGVGFALNHVQKWEDGERLDGRSPADESFDADLNEAPASLDGLV